MAGEALPRAYGLRGSELCRPEAGEITAKLVALGETFAVRPGAVGVRSLWTARGQADVDNGWKRPASGFVMRRTNRCRS